MTRDLPEIMTRPPVAIAHRGGVHLPANIGRENSLEAFAAAIGLGVGFIETDLRTTADGEVFAFHDPDLLRTVGRPDRFSSLTGADVRDLRLAGGAQIASLDDLLTEFPDVVLNLDFKDANGIGPGVELIRARGAADRVVVASFSHDRMLQVRSLAPELLTSASQTEVVQVKLGRNVHDLAARAGVVAPVALQVPETYRGIRIVTGGFVRRAHNQGMQVHVWTVDEPQQINRLLNLGVDGIITDRPDTLKQVLQDRGQWHGK